MAFQPHQNNNKVDGEEKREKERETPTHTHTPHTDTWLFDDLWDYIYILNRSLVYLNKLHFSWLLRVTYYLRFRFAPLFLLFHIHSQYLID